MTFFSDPLHEFFEMLRRKIENTSVWNIHLNYLCMEMENQNISNLLEICVSTYIPLFKTEFQLESL